MSYVMHICTQYIYIWIIQNKKYLTRDDSLQDDKNGVHLCFLWSILLACYGGPPLPTVLRRILETSNSCGDVHQWGYPNSWMVYFMENPINPMKIRKRTGGTLTF